MKLKYSIYFIYLKHLFTTGNWKFYSKHKQEKMRAKSAERLKKLRENSFKIKSAS